MEQLNLKRYWKTFHSPFWLLQPSRRNSLWTASPSDDDDIRVLALPRQRKQTAASECNRKGAE